MVAFKQAFIVSLVAGVTIGAPILVERQGAGVGAGCDAIFTDADTASGQVVKQAGAYLADKLKGGGLRRRQGAGVGDGCNAIFSDADTASGQIVKQAGAALAKDISGASKNGAGPARRQLDKMGAGIGYVVEALPGGQTAGEQIISSTGTIDGDGTEGSAQLGEALGEAELSVGNAITKTAFGTTDGSNAGTGAGGPPPPPGHKRQLDKMGAGIGYVVEALPGGQSAGEQIISTTGTVDGNGTEGSADLGEAIGQAELSVGDAITETAFGTTTNSGNGGGGSAPPAQGKAAPPPKGNGH